MCFFFSSRRRHTRCLSDWSSDVCSSDLRARDRGGAGTGRGGCRDQRGQGEGGSKRRCQRNRSEERRVGKECRCREGAQQDNKTGETDRAKQRTGRKCKRACKMKKDKRTN